MNEKEFSSLEAVVLTGSINIISNSDKFTEREVKIAKYLLGLLGPKAIDAAGIEIPEEL